MSTAGSRLGFYYIDVGDGGITHRGNIKPLSTSAPPWLIRAGSRLTQLAANYDGSSTSIQILDRWGWPLAASTPTAPEPVPAGLWLSRWLYRLILDDPQTNPAPLRTQSGQIQDEVVDQAIRGHAGHTLINQDGELRSRFAAPIVGPDGILGVIVGEQPRERYLSLTDSAFNGLVVKGSIALLLTVAALLSFALLVGRRLSKLTQQIGDHRKHVTQQPLVVSRLGDEIDDLAETFNSLMQEQQQLEDYLRALPRSLAHEIRTPVAIISASLEQLSDSTSSDAERGVIIHRASEGVQRLRNMLDSMNEANRLETSLASESKEPIDLANLLTQLRDAYEQTFPAWRFEFNGMNESADMSGAPDAIVQALDKLVSNATSFTPEGGLISLKLERRGFWWRIAISNPGPVLPADPLRLFSPMVTSRAGSDSQGSHMGLGLYIVRLVAEYHGGEPWAQNRADGSGAEVGFTVRA